MDYGRRHPCYLGEIRLGVNMQFSDWIGKTLTEVQDIAKGKGVRTRILQIDDTPMILTCDFDPSRVELIVENNIVTQLRFG